VSDKVVVASGPGLAPRTLAAPRSRRAHLPQLRCISTSPAGDALYDPAQVRGLFDWMSASYDRMNVAMSLGFSVRWRRQLLALVEAAPAPRRVLDLMSGRGETWHAIGRCFPDASIAAIDFAPAMVAQSIVRNESEFGRRIEVRCEDALHSSVPDASVDLVVSAYGLKTFDAAQTVRLADEVARVLRPGGRFAFIDVTEPRNRILRRAYVRYLRWVVPAAGLLLLSDPTEYRMLHRYLADYGDGRRAVEAFTRQGSLQVETRTHFFGCATSVYGRRSGGP